MEDQHYQNLISRLNKNDADGIGDLYDAYGDVLYGIILRIIKNEEASADCLQEVFVKIWKNGHQYDESKSRLFTWISRIARNTALNVLESKDYRQNKEIQKVENIVHMDMRCSSNIMEESMDLRGIVCKLEKKYQEIIHLIYFQGYTQKEVSETMGIPLGTVKTRVKGALKQLRNTYEHKAQMIAVIVLLVAGLIA